MPSLKPPRVSVIGTGVVGSTLTRVLFEQRYAVVSIINRSGKSALDLARAVKCKRVSTQVSDVAPGSELIIIATSDAAVGEVARALASNKKLKFKKLFVVHTSGVHSSGILEPLRKKGAAVASIHPIQSFPAASRVPKLKGKLKGIFYGVDAGPDAMQKAERLVRALGGTPVVIPAEMKPLYHVTCVFASASLMILMNLISELARTLGLKAAWTEVFGPLMTTAMENSMRYPIADVLTGPILRNDFETIDLHLSALRQYAPQFLPLYTVNAIEFGRIAKAKGRISQEDFDTLLLKFKKFVQRIPSKTIQR